LLGHWTYLFIILAPGFVFNLVVWATWWKFLKPRRKAIAAMILISSAYWGVLDLIAIRGLGIWSFQAEHITGIRALGLPIEEWALFFASGGFIIPLLYVFMGRNKVKLA
jgi:lycopene cyclase domain-containing protein